MGQHAQKGSYNVQRNGESEYKWILLIRSDDRIPKRNLIDLSEMHSLYTNLNDPWQDGVPKRNLLIFHEMEYIHRFLKYSTAKWRGY